MIAATIGVSRSRTSAVTTAPNAAPMTIPTARSTTFPLSRNALKSLAITTSRVGVSPSVAGPVESSQPTTTWQGERPMRAPARRCGQACSAPRRSDALEQGDALDVVRLREHVDRTDLAQHPSGVHQFGGVGGERGRVAGDVDDALGRGVDD